MFASVMLASAVPQPAVEPSPSLAAVHITGPTSSTRYQQLLTCSLGSKGTVVTRSSLTALSNRKWSGEWLILLDDAEDSILSTIQARELEGLKSWLLQPIHCIWATRNVHLLPRNPLGGLVTGFTRNLRRENDQLRLYTLDCSSSDDTIIVKTIHKLVDSLRTAGDDPSIGLNYELAERNGRLWTCRLEPDVQMQRSVCPPRELKIPLCELLGGKYSLIIREAGILDSLAFVQDDNCPSEQVPSESLLVEVKAVGLGQRVSSTWDFSSYNRTAAHIESRIVL